MRTKGVGHPTAVVESIEASTGIPAFEPEEFDLLMQDLEADAEEARQKLLTMVEAREARQ